MLDCNDSKNNIKFRVRIIYSTIALLGLLLVVNLYLLQINQAEKYSLLSKKNRIRLSPISPKRGRIITSDGEIAAKNVRQYKLLMDSCSKKNFCENIDLLSQSIVLDDGDKKNIFDSYTKSKSPIIIKNELLWCEYSKLSMILFKLNNVYVENTYSRDYVIPLEFSHVIGYTSKSDGSTRIIVGKTGIETVFNDQLAGKPGSIQTEVNSLGKKVRIIDTQLPIDGSDVTITIESQLQKYVYELMSQEKAGACVIIDIRSGEILAMVSVPAFNPNLISGKITHAQWSSIVNDPLFPLINRAVNCTYPPGSIFKIIIAFAALSEGIILPKDKVFCSGGIKQNDRVFHCWNRGGHGNVNLCDALRLSCDCYFFETAKKLGIDKIVEYAQKFGFGAETCIELPNESIGLLPTKKWRLLKHWGKWRPYETMIAGIGQGAVLSTLMQAAVMLGKLYTEDYAFSPTLIKGNRKDHKKVKINSVHAKIIKDALYHVCTSGTASGSCNTDYGISGKTGSSQVRKIKSNEAGINQKHLEWKFRDHAFFVGCAPYKDPCYVVAVLVEHGGSGAYAAAPIARKIFDRLMKK